MTISELWCSSVELFVNSALGAQTRYGGGSIQKRLQMVLCEIAVHRRICGRNTGGDIISLLGLLNRCHTYEGLCFRAWTPAEVYTAQSGLVDKDLKSRPGMKDGRHGVECVSISITGPTFPCRSASTATYLHCGYQASKVTWINGPSSTSAPCHLCITRLPPLPPPFRCQKPFRRWEERENGSPQTLYVPATAARGSTLSWSCNGEPQCCCKPISGAWETSSNPGVTKKGCIHDRELRRVRLPWQAAPQLSAKASISLHDTWERPTDAERAPRRHAHAGLWCASRPSQAAGKFPIPRKGRF